MGTNCIALLEYCFKRRRQALVPLWHQQQVLMQRMILTCQQILILDIVYAALHITCYLQMVCSSYIGVHIAGLQSKPSDVASVLLHALSKSEMRLQPLQSYGQTLEKPWNFRLSDVFIPRKKPTCPGLFAMLLSISLLLSLSYFIASTMTALVPSSVSLGLPAHSNVSNSLHTIAFL